MANGAENISEKVALRFALIGYGKMGRAIEEILLDRGHQVVLRISSGNRDELTVERLSDCDVAIEFTSPETAVENILMCFDAGLPVICGSTGWLKDYSRVAEYCEVKNGTLLYASNFSLGVNIFFEVNKKLAALMAQLNSYEVSVEETHHTQKKDAPSGTAITLAEAIIENYPHKRGWVNHQTANPGELTVISKRIDPAPGTHKVTYYSDVDEIEIKHTALNRMGFAEGAVIAALFVAGKKGIFTMQDVLNL